MNKKKLPKIEEKYELLEAVSAAQIGQNSQT